MTKAEIKNIVDQINKGMGDKLEELAEPLLTSLGAEGMTRKQAVAYVNQLVKDTEAKDEKVADAARKELDGLCEELGIVQAPGFIGGFVPGYYAYKHLTAKGSKNKRTGAGMLVKDAVLVGLGILTYLGARNAAAGVDMGVEDAGGADVVDLDLAAEG